MSSNLKFQIDFDTDVESLRRMLLEFSAYSKITALSVVDEGHISSLLDEIKICAYDYRPVVRAYAYKALIYAEPHQLTEILKDALRDENPDAFKAARELHQKIKQKAASR